MEKAKIEWKEAKASRSRNGQAFVGECEGFQLRASWDYDESYDFSHYGSFCEERSIGHKDFAIRNPNAWRKRDLGNGTDSWVRVENRCYGWFKLENHPKDEVEWYMKNENMPEREAWQKVLDRERETVQKLADGDLFGIIVKVSAYREGVELGCAVISGVEVENYVKDEDVFAALSDHGLVEEAVEEAKKTLKDLCTCH